MSRRIQRSRKKGWRMPAGAVYVGRPSRWGNPWDVGPGLAVVGGQLRSVSLPSDDVLRWYLAWVREMVSMAQDFLHPLRGRDLACWCPLDQPCHADVLLELANR